VIYLLSALGFIKRLFAAALAFALARPWQAAVIALVCLSAWLWHGKGVEHHKLVACQNDRAAMIAAQAKAKADQIAANKAVAQSYQIHAEKADEAYRDELAGIRAASDAYARSHGVRTIYRSAPSAGASPAVPDVASGDNGPGADSIVVSRADFDIVSQCPARLAKVHEWGDGLIAEGWAVSRADAIGLGLGREGF
jgi:hypothetical protein